MVYATDIKYLPPPLPIKFLIFSRYGPELILQASRKCSLTQALHGGNVVIKLCH